MALQDKKQQATSEAKNALEAYVYSLRNKLSDSLTDFATEADKTSISQMLEQMEVSIRATMPSHITLHPFALPPGLLQAQALRCFDLLKQHRRFTKASEYWSLAGLLGVCRGGLAHLLLLRIPPLG